MGGSNLSMRPANARPAVTWPIDDSHRDSQTTSDPYRPREECRKPSNVARVGAELVKI
jgi:hypothetical protein